ncbi:hypothetical protein H5410_026259 [Solanum commersonii]|uniref:Uncharacterized protein n=1 Tax=Solanum commersonii TaxID=4109 RepID=A0A9J5YYF4_SOLCO|nr:hypothetical protein H5410_026259 [Solanum commersonii]
MDFLPPRSSLPFPGDSATWPSGWNAMLGAGQGLEGIGSSRQGEALGGVD